MTSKNRQSGRKGREEAPVQERSGLPLKEEHLNARNGPVNDSTDGRPGRAQAMTTATSEPDLGMTIRRLREGRQLSLKEVAARSGLTQSFLSQVERNLTSPSVAS